MLPTQDLNTFFASSEADSWFERNLGVLDSFDPNHDLPLKLMSLYHLDPGSILEIGASNGVRMAAASERYGARAVAVEPSEKAIQDGKKKYPTVEFIRAQASSVPVQDQFDVVIVNFVFHWISRGKLLQSIAEVDRLIKDGGHLILGDFFPFTPAKVRYHHITDCEVYTYKQDYAAPFLATGLYRKLCLLTANHQMLHTPEAEEQMLVTSVDDSERSCVWLLQKDLEGSYTEVTLG